MYSYQPQENIDLYTCSIQNATSISTPGKIYSQHGMVVSDHALASEAGKAILEQGGNAIDAALGTAFALAVSHPQAGNIGGGGFLVFMDPEELVTTIDFRETAPLAASPDMFLDDDGFLIKTESHNGTITTSNHAGIRSIGVPGTVAGLWLAHEKYGKLPWNQIMEPAIRLASEGFMLSETLSSHAAYFYHNSNIPFLRDLFLNEDGQITGTGETWKQPELAQTLKYIRDHGRDGFYKGPVADAIVAFMQENGGLITQQDLDLYKAIERKPVHGTYLNYDIYSMGPPSSGGVALIEMMHMMEMAYHPGTVRDNSYKPVCQAAEIPFGSVAYVHLLTEVMRRAYADRAAFMGDPDFNPDIPIQQLISKQHAGKQFRSIDMHIASKSDSISYGQLYDGKSTTHISVIDQHMNAVSITYTLEYSYGSGLGVPELGFLFNNEMGDFNPVPGMTDENGLIGSDPNIIQPGKRMLSSMTPTIVSKEGKPILVIGSPGGRTIINTVFQTILNVLEFKMPVDDAIEAMKIHHQWLPDVIVFEKGRLSPETISRLESMGHQLKPRENLGRLMGIEVNAENHTFIGASDSSSPDGAAVGF